MRPLIGGRIQAYGSSPLKGPIGPGTGVVGMSNSQGGQERVARRAGRRRGMWARTWRRAGAVLALFVGGLAAPQPSVAGTYVMRNCDVPGYPRAPIGPWLSTTAPNVVAVDNCAGGGGFSFALPTRSIIEGTAPSLDLVTPNDAARQDIAFELVRIWMSARLTGTGSPLSVALGTGFGTFAAFESPGKDALETPVGQALSNVSHVRLDLTCDRPEDRPAGGSRSATGPCYANDPVPLEVRGLEVTLSEDIPPAGSAVAGTVLAGQPVSGVQGLEYSASDEQSGLVRVEAVIGEVVVGAEDVSASCLYADFTACPTVDRGTLSIDTGRVADGRHELSLRIFDAAGNRKELPVQSIVVQNSLSLPTSPEIVVPAAGSAHVTAGFAGSSRSSLVVPFGQRVTVRGRLTSTSGPGLSKARVDVFESSGRAGDQEVAAGHAQTRSDGTFSYKLEARRPSRTVRLAYGSIASSGLLKVRVRAGSTLKATLRGTTVRFSGRVLSRPLPGAGKLVWLQGRAPGYAWAPFAKLRADRHGRFSGSYRLRAHRPGVKLQFRVVVPAERGYRYLGNSGTPITLKVR
jgi:hypothetical protein